METPAAIPSDDQSQKQPLPQKRVWVTPAFEQVALKQALTGPIIQDVPEDGPDGSS